MDANTDDAARVRALSGALGPDSAVHQLLGQVFDPNIRFPDRPLFIDDVEVFELPDGLGFFVSGGEAPALLRGGDWRGSPRRRACHPAAQEHA